MAHRLLCSELSWFLWSLLLFVMSPLRFSGFLQLSSHSCFPHVYKGGARIKRARVGLASGGGNLVRAYGNHWMAQDGGGESGGLLNAHHSHSPNCLLSTILYCILPGHRALYPEAPQSSKRKTTLASPRGGTQISAFSTSLREFLHVCLPKCADVLSVVISSPLLVSMLVFIF